MTSCLLDISPPLCLKESCKLEKVCVSVIRFVKKKSDVAADNLFCLGYHCLTWNVTPTQTVVGYSRLHVFFSSSPRADFWPLFSSRLSFPRDLSFGKLLNDNEFCCKSDWSQIWLSSFSVRSSAKTLTLLIHRQANCWDIKIQRLSSQFKGKGILCYHYGLASKINDFIMLLLWCKEDHYNVTVIKLRQWQCPK